MDVLPWVFHAAEIRNVSLRLVSNDALASANYETLSACPKSSQVILFYFIFLLKPSIRLRKWRMLKFKYIIGTFGGPFTSVRDNAFSFIFFTYCTLLLSIDTFVRFKENKIAKFFYL